MSMVFAFIVVLLMTRNFFISLLAVTNILITIISVICLIVLRGWECGIAESMIIVMSVGLSCDFTVHIAATFCHSKYEDYRDRIKDAITRMGLSIIEGGLTTIGAAGFLLLCKTIVSFKLGFLVVATIIFSMIFSLLHLPASLYVIYAAKAKLLKIFKK